MGISPPQAHLTPPDHGIAARASSEEFERAVGACDFAVLVWELPDGVVALANEAALTLFDTSRPELLGTKNVDLVGPRDAVEGEFAALSSRAVENVRAERHVPTPDGFTSVRVWSRAVEVDRALGAVSLYVPVGELGAPCATISPASTRGLTSTRKQSCSRFSAARRRRSNIIWVLRDRRTSPSIRTDNDISQAD